MFNIVLAWVWVSTWFIGALIGTTYKWGFFVFGNFAFFLLAVNLLYTGSITARRVGIFKEYILLAGWLVFVWILYPIAWGIDDGGNVIGVTQGFVFFGILDVVTVPVLSLAVLALSLKFDLRALNLYFTQYGRVPQTGEFPEKTTTEKESEGIPAAPETGVVSPEQAV